jgi:Fic family protein
MNFGKKWLIKDSPKKYWMIFLWMNNEFVIRDKIMKVTDKQYFDQYKLSLGADLNLLVKNFDFDKRNHDLNYQTQASAVYSSNIEGNTVDLNSFMNYKQFQTKAKPQKELREIEDLISAYNFAQANHLTAKNLLGAHKILSKELLINSLRGKYRNDRVGVFSESGLVYLAVEAEYVPAVMKALFEEISELLTAPLSLEEVFYFASLIHLRFVHIHPFADGDGRAARLLEKWFITQKLGELFWSIPSEKYYKDHLSDYFTNINLGVNFYELDYNRSVPFLVMLPGCLK